jgi:hypothetical protein
MISVLNCATAPVAETITAKHEAKIKKKNRSMITSLVKIQIGSKCAEYDLAIRTHG